MPHQMSFQNLHCLKTCQDYSQATTDRTLGSSSRSSSKSANRPPRCLRWTKESGLMQTPSWETDGQLRTELSIWNIGDAPSVVVESTLSQILVENAPRRYALSVKACEGILRRSRKRGKDLPTMLQTALEQQIARGQND